jgi:hypothetical protein
VRVYVPATLAILQRLVADRSVRAVNGTAFAVTPTLRESYAEGDDDELADVTLRDAALASLRLLDHDAQDHDLAWYAAQELPFLLELL